MLTLRFIQLGTTWHFNYKRWRPTPQKLKDWQPLRLGCSRAYFLFLELLLVSAFLIFIHLSLFMVFFTAPFPVKYQNLRKEKKKQGHQIPWNFSYKRASGRVVWHFSFRYWTVGAAKKSIFHLRCSLSLLLLQYLSSAISFSEYAVILFNQQKQGSPNNRRAQHVKVFTPTLCFVDKCELFLTSLKMAAPKSPLCKISRRRLKYDFRLSAKKTSNTK